MSDADLAFAPATELAEMVRLKKVSPVELVDVFARRIEELNPRLGAYLTTSLDEARDEAKKAEASVDGDELPPFHGVPISIKDLNETKGVRTTYGCAAYSDRISTYDDEIVARIKRAGFIMLGKTNTPEYGTTCFTDPPGYFPARNPWDTQRTTGGSSGGAGGALAAGLCPIAHGSDGGGSVRIPAAFCGVFGLKPSRGRISHAPGPQSFLSQSGPLSRTVTDAAAFLDVVAGYVTGDSWWAPSPSGSFAAEATREPGRLRFAVSSAPLFEHEIARDNAQAAERAAELLSALGHERVEGEPPKWPDGLAEGFLVTWAVRTAAIDPLPAFDTLEPVNQALIEFARGIDAPSYEKAQRRIMVAARKLVAFFDDVDVLVTPTVAAPPPVIGSYRDPANPWAEFLHASALVPFTPPWNTTGQPAVSVPLYEDSAGLPLGVQIVGRPADEATLIRLSAQIEQAAPWADRRPPTC